MLIGSRIRELRRARNHTIAHLAELAGISTSLVSQVERDLISPSLGTLAAVASALGVTMASIFRESAAASVCRSGAIALPVSAELHAVAGRPGMRLGVTNLGPGQSRALGPQDEGAVGIVLHGSVDLDCGASRERLAVKDAFVLPNDGRGFLHNSGETSAEIYWVFAGPAS